MDPVKVAGVADWPEPCNKQEVQSFLEFTNFYRRFIKDFSHHARPLFNLTKNEQKWQWGTSKTSAFRKLKELVTSTPVLTTPADAGRHPSLGQVVALLRRSGSQSRDLDRPQKSRVLHVCKGLTKSQRRYHPEAKSISRWV
jgi:hypothetical protein